MRPGPGQVPDGFGFLNVPGHTDARARCWRNTLPARATRRPIRSSRKSEGYTHTLANAFEERFKELGGEIVGADFYTLGDTSYRVVATKMVNSDADVLMTNTFVPDTTAFLKDLERLGNTKPILLVDGNDTPVVFDGGPQLELGRDGDLWRQPHRRARPSRGSRRNTWRSSARRPESLQTALGYDLDHGGGGSGRGGGHLRRAGRARRAPPT